MNPEQRQKFASEVLTWWDNLPPGLQISWIRTSVAIGLMIKRPDFYNYLDSFTLQCAHLINALAQSQGTEVDRSKVMGWLNPANRPRLVTENDPRYASLYFLSEEEKQVAGRFALAATSAYYGSVNEGNEKSSTLAGYKLWIRSQIEAQKNSSPALDGWVISAFLTVLSDIEQPTK